MAWGNKWMALILMYDYRSYIQIWIVSLFVVMREAKSISCLPAQGILHLRWLLSEWITTRKAFTGSCRHCFLSCGGQCPIKLRQQRNVESWPVFIVTLPLSLHKFPGCCNVGLNKCLGFAWQIDRVTHCWPFSIPFQLPAIYFPRTCNTDIMCASSRRANMGGEYCLLFPIKPQRIKRTLSSFPRPSLPPSLHVILRAGNAGRLRDQWRSQARNTDQQQGELMPRLFSIPNWPLAQKPLHCD